VTAGFSDGEVGDLRRTSGFFQAFIVRSIYPACDNLWLIDHGLFKGAVRARKAAIT
jgi:hypothetical protein